MRLCEIGDRSLGEVAQDLDLIQSALRDGVQVADLDADNGSADALTTDEHAELVQFRAEHKELLTDREIRERAVKFVLKGSPWSR